MITPKDFKDRWNTEMDPLFSFKEDMIDFLNFSPQTKKFLTEAGLPESAPPYLNFVSSEKGGGVRMTNSDLFEGIDMKYNIYIYIGFLGDGDVICINETNDNIVYIEHEDDDHGVVFINSSIAHFLEFLLLFVSFIKDIKAVNGSNAFLKSHAPANILIPLIDRFINIDKTAIFCGNFWYRELCCFWDELMVSENNGSLPKHIVDMFS